MKEKVSLCVLIAMACLSCLMISPKFSLATESKSQSDSGQVAVQAGVILQSTQASQNGTNNCPNLTALLQNTSGQAANILIDFEVKDAAGNKISQDFIDNFEIGANQTVKTPFLHCVPPNGMHDMPQGTYSYSIGLFNPNWQGLLHWYDDVQTLAVATGKTDNSAVVLSIDQTIIGFNSPSQPTLHVSFFNEDAANSHEVLEDFELYDASGNRIFQTFFENQNFVPGAIIITDVTGPENLPQGNYRWAVGIFNPGWNGTLHWYNTAAMFTH